MTLLRSCRKKSAFFSIFFFLLLTAAVFTFNGLLQAGEAEDQCVICHTDMVGMKKMILKFPDPPQEEGEA